MVMLHFFTGDRTLRMPETYMEGYGFLTLGQTLSGIGCEDLYEIHGQFCVQRRYQRNQVSAFHSGIH